MNLAKIFNMPSLEQKKQIFIETQRIMKKCSEVTATERKEQKENQRTHDSKCPKCRGDKVVDRFANVVSVGKMKQIRTEPVNYCRSCTHEWEKFKMKSVTDLSVMKVILKYLSDVITNPELAKRYSWKLEAIKIFDGFHAESIYEVQQQYKPHDRNRLTIIELRRNYKSIFNKKEKS